MRDEGRRYSEVRTIREAREAIRELEASTERVHMAPAAVLAAGVEWYLRKARLALRQAERSLAERDEPGLKPLRPQLRDRRPATSPRRKRYRCPECFEELLADESAIAYLNGHHKCDAYFEPVLRRKGKTQ